MGKSGAVYLMYHEIEGPGRPLTQFDPGYVRYAVSAADFERQMQWLKSISWRGVCVSESLAFAAAPHVALTFDDGCETDLSVAAPILKQLNFSATFYITVGWVGKPGHLSAAQVRDLCHLGFEIGCHSMTHAYLAGVPASQLSDEIALAKLRLQQITGCRVNHFSCPGGRCDRRVVQMAKDAGYLSVATSRVAVNREGRDSFALGRIAVMRTTSMPAFQQICRGRGLWKQQLRQLARTAARTILRDTAYDRMRSAVLKR